MSLISSKDGMLPGGGTPPPLIAVSASYKFSQIYIYIYIYIYYLKIKLHKIKTSKTNSNRLVICKFKTGKGRTPPTTIQGSTTSISAYLI